MQTIRLVLILKNIVYSKYILSIDMAYYVPLYKFKISKLLTVNNLNYKWLLTRNLSIIIITSTTERRYYLCSGCYTYGMHDHVIPCLYPNRTFFVPKQDVFCTQTGRFLYPNRTFFSTLQHTQFYAIIMQVFAGME